MATEQQMKSLLKSQQAELDGVLLYKKLAEMISDKKTKEVMLEIAADEGKHAAILKSYTNEVLTPKGTNASIIGIMYKVIGAKRLFKIMAGGETQGAKSYENLVGDFPKLQELIDDELKHARLLSEQTTA